MGINTDLNIDPYFDDYDETKQFSRVLFRPARAVQARELTQLQTVLQNQIERFGSNVYKEGTVVSGINLALRREVKYIKITDSGIPDPTIYSQTYADDGAEINYILRGQSTGLEAKIILGENGFETRDPNLKTFYIQYLDTNVVGGVEVKQFESGETLVLVSPDNVEISSASITVASVNNHAGSSLGMSVKEGIIFQKGHFIFVEEQFIIVSKYTDTPADVSVGFSVEESIVSYADDSSLLDNAQGFNNYNAPGADRLRLRPVLTVVPSTTEPENFFALSRFQDGQQIDLRDVTQFNSVATAMARRTYEESGNYVVRGMNVSLEPRGEDTNGDPEVYAVVSPGKAYSFGYEVESMAPKFLRIPFETETVTKTGQGITGSYGQYFEVDMDAGDALNAFALNSIAVSLYDNASPTPNEIGNCYVRNVEPGRVYVFGVTKFDAYKNSTIYKVADTPVKLVSGVPVSLQGTRNSAMVFDAGNPNTKSITNVTFTKRIRGTISNENGLNTNTNTFVIPNTAAYTPTTKNIILVDNVSNVVPVVGVSQNLNGDITVTYDPDAISSNNPGDPSFFYFDAIVSGTSADQMQQMDVFVKTVVQSDKTASLGLPNVVRINSVINQGTNGQGTTDITGRFTLVNTQKDTYYDKSYMKLKPGAVAPAGNETLLINMTVFRRISTTGNGYLDASSYANVDQNLVRDFSSNEGRKYNLLASVDFRPYATFQGSYALSPNGAENVGNRTDLSFPSFMTLANESVILGDIEYYLPRFDAVVVDAYGKFSIVKGEGSENPSTPNLKDVFTLAEIYVPGVITATKGDNALRVKPRSTRNYTMRDIEKIDKQIDRLTEVVSLSLLENETNNLTITDANGNNRFKNGILVDGFKNIDVADILDPDYKAAIDKTYRIASPSILQFPIDLEVASEGNVSVQRWEDITTLGETGSYIQMLKQPYATNYRNAVSNFYSYKGKAFIHPEFDSGYDVIENPAVNISIDIATPLLDLVDNLQEFVPLTRSSSSTRVTGQTTTRGGGGRTVTTTSQTTTTTDTLVGEVTEATETVGNFVTDIEFKPFIERRFIQVLVSGLRPNTVHHIFFDEENVDTRVRPAVRVRPRGGRQPTARWVFPVGSYGDDIRTDAGGNLAAVLLIPARTYYVGEHEIRIADVDQYGSITSGGTSRAKATYRAYNFDVGKSDLTVTTRTPSFDIDQTVTTTNNTTSRFIPDPPPPSNGGGGGGSCFVKGTVVTMADGSQKKIEEVEIGEKLLGQDGSINTVLEHDHPMLDGRDLIGINGSGAFNTPEHPFFTKDGWKAYSMADTLRHYPHLEEIMNGDLEVGDEILTVDGTWMTIESLEVFAGEPEQQVYNFILDGNNTYFANGLLAHNRDPLSQTFFVKSGMAKGATTVFLREIDLFFKARTDTDTTMADVTPNGVTIEMREVVNGYPSDAILPFGRKHLDPSEVNVSQDGSVVTNVKFDNPLRLNIEKEYAFVVLPDALDPNYLVFTSKVGGTDLNSGVSVTQDWGDGVLFTSTNGKAWHSYQDEDVKFTVRRLEFSTNSGSVDFVPKQCEFFTVSNNVGDFVNDELVYALKDTSEYVVGWNAYTRGVSAETAQTITIPETTTDIYEGGYILITQGTNKHLAKVLQLTYPTGSTVALLDVPPSASLDADSTATTTVRLAIAGKVSYYNHRKPDILHLKESSVNSTYNFTSSDNLIGFESGSTATIASVDDIPVSYFQPQIYQSNTSKTTTEYKLKNDDESGTYRAIPSNDATYLTNSLRKIASQSNIKSTVGGTPTEQTFVLRVAMNNNAFTTTSPIVDDDLSRVNVYQYQISDLVDSSSAYVSKKVILQESVDAVGLKVLLGAYRPPGTMIDVFGRFTYPSNAEADSDWVQLDVTTRGETLYSNASNIRDYRDFEYNLDEETYTDEFSSFQVKIVMRHATSDELETQGLTGITPDVNLFAHVFDYRAIALT